MNFHYELGTLVVTVKIEGIRKILVLLNRDCVVMQTIIIDTKQISTKRDLGFCGKLNTQALGSFYRKEEMCSKKRDQHGMKAKRPEK